MRDGVPNLRYNRTSGRYYIKVRDAGRRCGHRWFYLGADRQEAQRRYDEWIHRWTGAGRDLSIFDKEEELPEPAPGEATVADLSLQFWRSFVSVRYLRDGVATSERAVWRSAIRFWVEACGTVRLDLYNIGHHEAARQLMIDRNLSRATIGRYMGRLGKILRWCEARGWVPRGLSLLLRELDPMPSTVRRSPGVKPVPLADFKATLEHASPELADLAMAQLYLGCRPAEACNLKMSEIDTDPPDLPEDFAGLWVAKLVDHKCAWRGQSRELWIGAQARSIIERRRGPGRDLIFLRPDGEPWTVEAYRHQLATAATRAGVPVWRPNMVRHLAASLARASTGDLSVAQQLLGHRRTATTEVYATPSKVALLAWVRAHG